MSRNARLASVVAVARAVRLAARPGGPSIGERAGSVPRMVRATFSGQYTGVSKGRLLLMLAAAGYIVSPIDLIPEAVAPVLGLADDALVLSWLATRPGRGDRGVPRLGAGRDAAQPLGCRRCIRCGEPERVRSGWFHRVLRFFERRRAHFSREWWVVAGRVADRAGGRRPLTSAPAPGPSAARLRVG